MNNIARSLHVVGWVFIVLGLVLGLMEAKVTTLDEFGIAEESFSFTLFITYFAACGFSGLLLLGFGEIINLLDKGNHVRSRIEDELKFQYKMEKDKEEPKPNKQETLKQHEPSDYSSVEEELQAIENNPRYSADMKEAMKAMVNRREGIE